MCGIYGISDEGSGIDRAILVNMIKELMKLSETRGKDASGMAVMYEDEMNVIRKAKSAHELLKDVVFLEYLEKNILRNYSKKMWVIGHSRLVTNGTQYKPENNQPVAKGHIALVHNGIVVNENELWRTLPEEKHKYEVDSEVILELIRKHYQDTRIPHSALEAAFNQIKGMASILCLIQNDHRFLAASNNGSLYMVSSYDKKLSIFASESLMLRKLIKSNREIKEYLDENTLRKIDKGEYIVLGEGEGIEPKPVHITQDKESVPSNVNANIFDFSSYEIDFDRIKGLRRCTRCVLPETMPFIEFDNDGVCNYCKGYRKAQTKSIKELESWTDAFHRNGKKAIVSFSGGRDSSYGLHYFVKEMGIKPMAYCYDWGMVTDLARRNQSRMCDKLDVEFILVSADIKKKRENIRKNVQAWLKRPSLGMIPIFMAGDKQYYYYANKIIKDYGMDTMLMATNPLEKTYFKFGYCGVRPDILKQKFKKLDFERLPASDVLKMSAYYVEQFAGNRAYINSSVFDTATATMSYYVIPHNYFRLYEYIPWDEKTIDETLNQYDWEHAEDADTTWRIGDGTAPFYNYIYCMIAGFTENDTLRSNQIREGAINRDEALKLVYRDNKPRFESMRWYFDAINVDMKDALNVISKMPKLY